MNIYELEAKTGVVFTPEEFRKIELVFMNTRAIGTQERLIKILEHGGMTFIEILYSLVEERGNLIETVGELKTELSDAKKENRRLREFRDAIIKEAEKYH